MLREGVLKMKSERGYNISWKIFAKNKSKQSQTQPASCLLVHLLHPVYPIFTSSCCVSCFNGQLSPFTPTKLQHHLYLRPMDDVIEAGVTDVQTDSAADFRDRRPHRWVAAAKRGLVVVIHRADGPIVVRHLRPRLSPTTFRSGLALSLTQSH